VALTAFDFVSFVRFSVSMLVSVVNLYCTFALDV